MISPAVLVTALGLIGTFASLFGNEMAIRLGRRKLVQSAMFASVLLGGTIGFLGTASYTIAAGLMLFYGFVIWLELVIVDGRCRRHSGALSARRNARGPFDARLCGWLRWSTHDGLDAGSQRRHVDLRLGHFVCRRRRADASRLDRVLVDPAAGACWRQGPLRGSRSMDCSSFPDAETPLHGQCVAMVETKSEYRTEASAEALLPSASVPVIL